jgi:hypothetical protein
MKRLRLHALVASLAATAVATSFVACEKKQAEQPPQQPGQPKAAEQTKPAAAPAPALPPADIAPLKAAYGFAARLPNDVEGFSASYRLHDLWVKLSGSKWASVLLNMDAVKKTPQLQQFIEQWKSAPQAQMMKNLLGAVLGSEYVAALPAGFAAKVAPWVDLVGEVQALNFRQQMMTAMSGGKRPDPGKLFRDAAPDLIPVLVKCDIPPMFFAYKAAKARQDLDAMLTQFVQGMSAKAPPGVQFAPFKLADKYSFQSVTIEAGKLIAAFDEARVQVQLKNMLGDDDKAQKTMNALKAKRAELAWGWVDDYLVVSLGTDHSHLKLAAGDADSALAIPAVARRAGEFLSRNPMALSYASAAMFEKLNPPMEISKGFDALTGELEGLIKPDQLATMRTDVKRLEGKAQAIFNTKYDASVGVEYWDGGFRMESFGGAHMKGLDSSRPLKFAGLMSPTTMMLLNARTNPAMSGKMADLVEECATTAWGWYEKFGRTMVPEDERQGAAMVEAIAIPIVKDFWNACRQLGKGLGDESAFVFDLAGPMPEMPMIPPMFAEGKIPRMAGVWELKDRAAVSEAWKGFDKIVKQLTALVPAGASGPAVPEPQVKKEGDVELHFVPLPMPTGDLLPHIAISKDRWILSSSPSLSKELAAQPASTGGSPLGSEWRLRFPALCDLGDAWVKVIDKDPKTFFRSESDAREYQEKVRATLVDLITLMRSLKSIEVRMFEEGGQPRTSAALLLEDVK